MAAVQARPGIAVRGQPRAPATLPRTAVSAALSAAPATRRQQSAFGWASPAHAHHDKLSSFCRVTAADRPGSGSRLAAYGLQLMGGSPQTAPVDIAMQPGPSNSRCIFSGVSIGAPAQAVYAALTSYEALGTFIPGLAENRCLERYPDGCKLLQVGQQDLALGFKFCARVCLRIKEYPAGMPARLLGRSPSAGASSVDSALGRLWWPFGSSPAGPAEAAAAASSDGQAFSEARFLRPRSPLGLATPMDISFELVDGDFAAFKGLWRVQAAGPDACRLSYTLFVRPQPWLLVGLIEQRVQDEIAANLAAVKMHVEGQMAAGARPPPPSLL